MANDYEDCGNYGSQSRIRCHCCTDVHPAQSQHLQRTAKDNTRRHITKNKTNQRAGNQRTMELCFVEHTSHTGDSGHHDEQNKLYTRHNELIPLRDSCYNSLILLITIIKPNL